MATWSDVLGQIRAEVEEATADIWTDAQILALWNEGQHDFACRVKPLVDEQYVIAATSQQSYTLPSSTIDLKAAYWGAYPIAVTDYWSFAKKTTTGKPTTVAFYDEAAYLYPIPSTAGTLSVLRWLEPAAVTAATNTVAFSNKHTFAIKNWCKARMYEQIQEFDVAQSYDSLYQREVAESEWENTRSGDSAMVRLPTEAW